MTHATFVEFTARRDATGANSHDQWPTLLTARVGGHEPGEHWQVTDELDRACSAKRATGCLLEPLAGDRVLCYRAGANQLFILSVLERDGRQNARVNCGGERPLDLSAPELTLRGDRKVTIQSRRAIDLACLGDIRLQGKNLLASLAQSIVQLATHYVNKAEHISLEAKQLLRSHGHHQLITAREDVKIDGERINMG